MIVINRRKDLRDLWCMALADLGGRARKCEIFNWVHDRIETGLISMPYEIRGSWPVDMGHEKDHLKPPGVIKSTQVGKYTYWSFV